MRNLKEAHRCVLFLGSKLRKARMQTHCVSSVLRLSQDPISRVHTIYTCVLHETKHRLYRIILRMQCVKEIKKTATSLAKADFLILRCWGFVRVMPDDACATLPLSSSLPRGRNWMRAYASRATCDYTRHKEKHKPQSTAYCPSTGHCPMGTFTSHLRHTALSRKRKRHVRVRGAPVCAAHVPSEGRPARGRGSRQAVLRTSALRVRDPRGCVKRSTQRTKKRGIRAARPCTFRRCHTLEAWRLCLRGGATREAYKEGGSRRAS